MKQQQNVSSFDMGLASKQALRDQEREKRRK
jgi:hypothetical protein